MIIIIIIIHYLWEGTDFQSSTASNTTSSFSLGSTKNTSQPQSLQKHPPPVLSKILPVFPPLGRFPLLLEEESNWTRKWLKPLKWL